MPQAASLAITRRLDRPFAQALADTRAALQSQGFGVLTEIDVQATLREKLGASFRRYVILGACHPPLAQRALTANLDVGLILPCNVIVYEDGADRSVVSAFDPEAGLGLLDDEHVTEVACEAKERLAKALEAL